MYNRKTPTDKAEYIKMRIADICKDKRDKLTADEREALNKVMTEAAKRMYMLAVKSADATELRGKSGSMVGIGVDPSDFYIALFPKVTPAIRKEWTAVKRVTDSIRDKFKERRDKLEQRKNELLTTLLEKIDCSASDEIEAFSNEEF